MRRREKAIAADDELEELLSRTNVCRLGLHGGDWPYVVPVHFGYEAGAVYFHSAPQGRKLDLLRKDSRVCVEAEGEVEVVPGAPPCRSTTRYRSVIAFGRATFLEEREEKRRALALILRQCGVQGGELGDPAVDAVAVVRVALEEVTGKRSPA